MQKKISIIIPIYNEAKNIPIVTSGIINIFKDSGYDYEIIFVNDGSADDSGLVIHDLVSKNLKLKSIEFSRNFGKEAATTAGLQNCIGDAAIIVDADMQHPTELILNFIKKWEEGYEVVIGRRTKSLGIHFFKKITSSLYYKIINIISDTEIAAGATDFRLLDRVVIEEFNKLTERERMTRGLIDWLGFKKIYVDFVEDRRKSGIPAYTYLKLTKLAISSFVAHSLFPLKFAGYLGIFIIFLSGLGGTAIFIESYFLGDMFHWNVTGVGKLALLLIFLTGITLSCLGLIALYVGNIHNEVSGRPLYVIKKKRNSQNN